MTFCDILFVLSLFLLIENVSIKDEVPLCLATI